MAAHTAETSARVYIDTARARRHGDSLRPQRRRNTRPIAPGDTVSDVAELERCAGPQARIGRPGPVRYPTLRPPSGTLPALTIAKTPERTPRRSARADAGMPVHFVDTAGNVTPIVLGPVYVR
ncbi:MAG: hypothetical protein R2854_25820 [Caldilineaceae bacterium]